MGEVFLYTQVSSVIRWMGMDLLNNINVVISIIVGLITIGTTIGSTRNWVAMGKSLNWAYQSLISLIRKLIRMATQLPVDPLFLPV